MLSHSDQGQGPVLVLIHGFCESKELWEDFSNSLSKDYRVICPDLPGFGKSPLLESNISISWFASEINNLLVELNIDQCVMIGHSLGGYVALSFAELYPDKLKGLGLFHSTAFADTEEKKHNRNKTITFIEKHGVPLFAQSFVAPLFSETNRIKFAQEISTITKIAADSFPNGVIETTKAMRDRLDTTHVLSKINVPVLFIAGKEDGSVPLEKTMEQCSLPSHSVVQILEGAGHMGMVEKKEETLKMINAFLRIVYS